MVECSSALVSGHIFDAADDTRVTVGIARETFARAAGAKGSVVLAPAGKDFFSVAMEATAVASGQKLRRVLGWRPKHVSVMDDVNLLTASVLEHRK